MWRVFAARPGTDGKPRLVATNREASPVLKLDPGDYLVNVAFGRANLTRKVTVSAERAVQERFVLNAGGLRLIAGAGRAARRSTSARSSTTSFPTSATSTASAPRSWAPCGPASC